MLVLELEPRSVEPVDAVLSNEKLIVLENGVLANEFFRNGGLSRAGQASDKIHGRH